MLNLNSNNKYYNVPLRIVGESYIISSKKLVTKQTLNVIIAKLTNKEEEELDNGNSIQIKVDAISYNIDPKNVYCYGDIDFNHSSDDYKLISTFRWLEHLIFRGICVPSNYNLKTHSCASHNHKPMWYDTVRPEIVTEYAYGCIGKPKKVIIFKDVR